MTQVSAKSLPRGAHSIYRCFQTVSGFRLCLLAGKCVRCIDRLNRTICGHFFTVHRSNAQRLFQRHHQICHKISNPNGRPNHILNNPRCILARDLMAWWYKKKLATNNLSFVHHDLKPHFGHNICVILRKKQDM